MLSYKECQGIIESKISDLCLNSHPAELYDPIRYILSVGGKRLRPCLTLMANNLFTEDITSAIDSAVALEIFHNFTLLHDDIMDNASVRRNKETVHVKWNNNAAILSGDAMMILAYSFISKCPKEVFPRIFEVFNKTALEVCEGQQLDMNFENRDSVSEEEYLEMIRLKTAVLISASLAIGGIVAGVSKNLVNTLYDLGTNIGLAFQIQDDYLDSFGDPAKFGKAIGGDILANKKTYLLISALNSGDKIAVQKLKELILNKEFIPEEKINAVVDIYMQTQVNKKTNQLITYYFDRAVKNLSELTVSVERKVILKDLFYKMMKRES